MEQAKQDRPMLETGRIVEVYKNPWNRTEPMGLAELLTLVRGPRPDGYEDWELAMMKAPRPRVVWTVHDRDLVLVPRWIPSPETSEGCTDEAN